MALHLSTSLNNIIESAGIRMCHAEMESKKITNLNFIYQIKDTLHLSLTDSSDTNDFKVKLES